MKKAGQIDFSRSFSLVEMALGMAILVLVFGGIFNVVQGTLVSADVADSLALRAREEEGLFILMREICLGLPPQSQIQIKNSQDLILTDAPVAILRSGLPGQRILHFSLEKDPVDGNQKNLFLEETIVETNSYGQATTNAINRFLLMDNLKEVRWIPGSPNPGQLSSRDWQEAIKPPFLRLDVVRRQARGLSTNTAFFWIPTGYGPGGRPPLPLPNRPQPAATNSAVNPPA
jgi:hypothetical protein